MTEHIIQIRHVRARADQEQAGIILLGCHPFSARDSPQAFGSGLGAPFPGGSSGSRANSRVRPRLFWGPLRHAAQLGGLARSGQERPARPFLPRSLD